MLRPNAPFKTLNQPISLLTPRFSGNTTQTGWHTVQFKLCKEHLLMYVDWVHCTVSHTDNIIRNPFKQGGESPPQLLFHHPHTHTHKPIRRSKKSAVPTVCWLGGWQKCWRRGDGARWPSSSSSVLHCSWNDEPGCPDCAGTNVLTWWSQKWPVKRTNTRLCACDTAIHIWNIHYERQKPTLWCSYCWISLRVFNWLPCLPCVNGSFAIFLHFPESF